MMRYLATACTKVRYPRIAPVRNNGVKYSAMNNVFETAFSQYPVATEMLESMTYQIKAAKVRLRQMRGACARSAECIA